MIKLPIVLTVHENSWESAIGDALRTRLRLADLAAAEPDYIRPILIQAENKDKPANVDAVKNLKNYLLGNEHLPEECVAVATGEQRELDGINLFDPNCPTEVIITVQALKEGWDCSFAYVFFSTANISSGRDVEQLLGRVLRMPYARRRKTPELNKAYAHVSSPNFVEAAKQLETSMIALGFEDVEAKQYLEVISDYVASVRAHLSPMQRGEHFNVPRLCVRYQGELELFERELILDAAGWNLLDYAPNIEDFQFHDSSKTFEFDVDGSRVVYHFMGELQLDLNLLATQWTPDDLVRWLDKQLRQPDIRQETLAAWLGKAVRQLLSNQPIDLATLVRAKFIFARKLEDKIKECRTVAYNKGYQELLFGPNAVVETSYDYAFAYDADSYLANWLYSGRHKFTKHFYALPGELQGQGEEFECAVALDAQSSLKHWVRNLSNQPISSLWLQTATDRFYPDFVAELADGRLLMVEYKGALTAQTEDTDEKRRPGGLWESHSNGRALFLIAEKLDAQGRGMFDQIKTKIEECN